MKKYAASSNILGVTVSGRSIQAVLIHEGPDGPEVVRRFSRQAVSAYAGGDVSSPSTPSEITDESTGDFTIKFGGSAASNPDIFLSSEFRDLNPDGGEQGVGHNEPRISFEVELEDILGECREAGYPDPLVAFCEPSSAVTTAEIRMPTETVAEEDDDKKSKKKTKSKTGKAELVELLAAQLDLIIDEDRVGFISMTPADNGQTRFLGIVSQETGPVSNTLVALRSRKARMPSAQLLDNEVAIYLGLARSAYYLVTSDEQYADESTQSADMAFSPLLPGDSRKTLVVRAGLEDTLVLFLEDEKLLHYESLRSITTYDAPETICSRVLLLQDEYGIGDVQHVLLLSDDREEAIVESFKMFFSDTRVEALRDYVPIAENEDGVDVSASAEILATGAALRLSTDELYQGSFEDINLLPKKLLKRRVRIPVTWHVFALYGILFASALFWVGRYFTIELKVNEQRQKLQQYPAEYTEADPDILQARVDSLRSVTQGYQRALVVLDSLLRGSDAWSRSLELTSSETAAVRGIWIDSWRTQGQFLQLSGNATSRDRIVDFAERTDGDIQTVTFSEIREWPVYSFTMKIRIPGDLPEAAKYLREQVELSNESARRSGDDLVRGTQ